MFSIETDGPVARITLANPKRRNALGLQLMQKLTEALGELGPRTDIGVIVVAAEGPAFSAGHDLSEMVDRDPEFYDGLFAACTHLMDAIREVPQPVIAEVAGVATAAGCQLVAACDLAVASTEATFATPGVRIGLFCSTPMVPISRAVGRKRAMEMLLTGEPIDADTAAQWGLVNRVVPPDRLREATDELAARITRFSDHTIAIGKQAFYRQLDCGEPQAYDLTRQVMAANAATDDAQEGIDAFLAKRPPSWSGRQGR
ncbi:enoyl-CoA hydratase [Candidatus Poriferisocius sp.]|uniref:enoyl-CoA hydratase n=1 Tax=Candidatus Poriferisocius sp. TaxID=3101276 RepID=UPI003B5C4635